MSAMFEGKVSIVTGSGRGIGRAIALAFAREGADVTVNVSRNMDQANKVVREIEEMGRRAIAIKADVSKKEDAVALVRATIDAFGKVDILVNNAGVARPALLHEMTEEEWDRVIEVDLKGVFNCIQAVVPYMMKQRYGKIINISSTAGVLGFTGNANYAAAKAGCEALTKTAAKELAKYGIYVNCVAPGLIETEMSKAIRENPKLKEKYLSWTLLRRFGKPEEVAAAVLFLASDKASYITGQTLYVDGGQLICVA